MKYEPTVKSAIDFSNSGVLEEWIHLFLRSEGDNVGFSDGLKLFPRKFAPPTLMDLNQFVRCCGPESDMKWQIDEKGFNTKVHGIMDKYRTGTWDMPPLIIGLSDGMYEVNDGNHRIEALKRLKIDKYWVIIWSTVEVNV
jgi:hypothetical protein